MASTPPETRTIRLAVQYDGTDFAGWQSQPETRTVQGVLHEAVEKMVHHPIILRATSRTDAGVHAIGLPVTFETDRDISEDGFLRGLNCNLPDDVSITQVNTEPAGYRIRDVAVAKTYRYQVQLGPVRWALLARQAWSIPQPTLDLDAMRQAAEQLLGQHDFSSFRSAGCNSASPIRYIHSIHIWNDEETPTVTFDFIGNAFLRNMIRILAGTLVEVGIGRRTPAWVTETLLAKDRRKAGPTAPARGLTLMKVHFEGYPRLGKSPLPKPGDG
jgi:tRNA pseudouridine38-40 synthase